jgi:hypothetical protein
MKFVFDDHSAKTWRKTEPRPIRSCHGADERAIVPGFDDGLAWKDGMGPPRGDHATWIDGSAEAGEARRMRARKGVHFGLASLTKPRFPRGCDR